LIRADGGPAGFALVDRGSKLSDDPDVTDMAQFFVLRGCGDAASDATAAHAVFRTFPGPWEVRVLEVNVVALPFWERTIGGLTGNRLARERCARPDGSFWQVFGSPADRLRFTC
jgi:predicted acetyltransferase